MNQSSSMLSVMWRYSGFCVNKFSLLRWKSVGFWYLKRIAKLHPLSHHQNKHQQVRLFEFDNINAKGPVSRKSWTFSGAFIILFVSKRRRRLKAQNLAIILIFIPFTTHQKTSLTEQVGWSFTSGFSCPKSFQDFRETGPRGGGGYCHMG